MAHKMAIESDRVIGDTFEVSEFPEIVQRYQISGVPKIVVNDVVDFVGAQPEGRFLDQVLRAVPKNGDSELE